MTAKLLALPRPPVSDRKTVTVYHFRVNVPCEAADIVTQGATDQFITALVKSGHFRVVERHSLQDLAAEKNLYRSGEAEGGAAAARLMGADYIFQGAITEMEEISGSEWGLGWLSFGASFKVFTASVGMDVRVVDAGTGEVRGAIDVRKKVRDVGFGASKKWEARARARLRKAMSLAVRECIEAAVYEIARKFGGDATKPGGGGTGAP